MSSTSQPLGDAPSGRGRAANVTLWGVIGVVVIALVVIAGLGTGLVGGGPTEATIECMYGPEGVDDASQYEGVGVELDDGSKAQVAFDDSFTIDDAHSGLVIEVDREGSDGPWKFVGIVDDSDTRPFLMECSGDSATATEDVVINF